MLSASSTFKFWIYWQIIIQSKGTCLTFNQHMSCTHSSAMIIHCDTQIHPCILQNSCLNCQLSYTILKHSVGIWNGLIWKYRTKDTLSVIDQQINFWEICNVIYPTETEMWMIINTLCKSWDGQSENYVDKIAANTLTKLFRSDHKKNIEHSSDYRDYVCISIYILDNIYYIAWSESLLLVKNPVWFFDCFGLLQKSYYCYV